MDNHTEALADGVWRVQVAPATNAFVLQAEGGRLTIVDTGTRGSGPRLVRSVRLLGLDPHVIDEIVLTHWHADHTGSAARFAASGAAPQVLVGRADLAAVRGLQPRPQAGRPADDVTALGRLLGRFTRPGAAVADAAPLDDGQELTGGAVVVSAPGHTAGHIALHLPDRGVLIAGDAVMNLGRLTRGLSAFRSAMSQEASTLQRLAALEFDVLALGHGPPVVNQAQERLRRLAQKVAGAR